MARKEAIVDLILLLSNVFLACFIYYIVLRIWQE